MSQNLDDQQQSPEGLLYLFMKSINNPNYVLNTSLWTLQSRTDMLLRDKESNEGKEFWEKKWSTRSAYQYTLLRKMLYSKFIVIEYEVNTGKSKHIDSLAMEKINDKWYATQTLGSHPVFLNWQGKESFIQINAPDGLPLNE